MTDNTATVTYINEQGCKTQSVLYNSFTKEIWMIFQKYRFHLSAAHIQGKHNILEDISFGKFQDSPE